MTREKFYLTEFSRGFSVAKSKMSKVKGRELTEGEELGLFRNYLRRQLGLSYIFTMKKAEVYNGKRV